MGLAYMKLSRTPMSVDLAITNRCNLRCEYCSYFSAADVSEDLPCEEWLRFFEELGSLAVLSVTLQGGEPFYREDLKEIIGGIIRNRMRYSILSNGTLITEEMAAFISSTGRCDCVQVSIDGSVPATHDAFRGDGSFRKAMDGIQLLQKHGVPNSVRVTIHRKNVRELEEIAKLLLEDVGLSEFSTNAASYMGLCRQNPEQVQLTVDERSLAMATLMKLSQKYKGRINAAAGPFAEGQRFLEMEKYRRRGVHEVPGKGYLTGCSGPMTKMAVRADGALVPCTHLSHMELGRANKDELKRVWLRHPELDHLRKRHRIPLSSFKFCSGCDYLNYCTGNCPALSYTILGEVNHPSPDACLKRFLEAGGVIPDPEEIIEQSPFVGMRDKP